MGNMYSQIYRDSKAVDDATRVMLQDIRERKELARNAGRRKSGAESTKCSLSTDHMTRKEWEAKNGEVETMMAPMRWDTYQKKTDQYKAKFLKWIRESLCATVPMIASMMGDGVDQNQLRTDIERLKSKGFDVGKLPFKNPTKGYMKMWNAWITKYHWYCGYIDIDAHYAELVEKRKATEASKKLPKNPIIKENKTKEGEETMTLKTNVSEPIPVQPSKAVEPKRADQSYLNIKLSTGYMPIDSKTFQDLKLDTQVLYINALRGKYQANEQMLTKMMGGTSAQWFKTWKKRAEKAGYTIVALNKGAKDEEYVEQWNHWIDDNNWPMGKVEAGKIVTRPKKSKDTAEKLVSEKELAKHAEKLGVTMSTPEEEKVNPATTAHLESAKVVGRTFVNTMTAKAEDIETVIDWVRSGLTFLKAKKVVVTVTVEE